MNVSETRLAKLFNRYYEKTATPQETEELMQLLREAQDDEWLTGLIKQAWENLRIQKPVFSSIKSEEIISEILQSDSAEEHKYYGTKEAKLLPWRKVAAAAAILIAIGSGAYFWTKKAPRQVNMTTALSHNDVLPGGNRATLTLADGSTIILDNAREGVLAKQGKTEIKKFREGAVVYSAGKGERNAPDFLFNTISTPKGGQFQIVLPDSSRVWLNAASSIRFPIAFSDNERKVEITGEVYFEVARNESAPFKVVMDGAEVEVLGTIFNVMAYSNETAVETTLLEGSIKITSQNYQLKTPRSTVLSSGQQALLTREGNLQVINNIDTEGAVAWKNGLFQFQDADIEMVMRQAARWYDIDVRYKGNIPLRQFTGKIPRNVHLSELLNMLNYAGVNSKLEGKVVTIMPPKSKVNPKQ